MDYIILICSTTCHLYIFTPPNDIIAITREQLPEDGYLFSETGIAQAVGLNGVTVETPEGFAQALRRALSAQTATVIDAQVDPQAYRDSFMVTTGIVP